MSIIFNPKYRICYHIINNNDISSDKEKQVLENCYKRRKRYLVKKGLVDEENVHLQLTTDYAKYLFTYSEKPIPIQSMDENSRLSEKAFVLETLRRITPDTTWTGELNHDSRSDVNIYVLEDMIAYLLDKLLEYSNVPGNESCKQNAKAKQKAFQILYNTYFSDMYYSDSEENADM